MTTSFSMMKKAIDYMIDGRALEAGKAFASAINSEEIKEIYAFLEEKEEPQSLRSRYRSLSSENEIENEEHIEDDDDDSYIRSLVEMSVEQDGIAPSRFEGYIKSGKGPLKIKG